MEQNTENEVETAVGSFALFSSVAVTVVALPLRWLLYFARLVFSMFGGRTSFQKLLEKTRGASSAFKEMGFLH